jgi:hypothetical protein
MNKGIDFIVQETNRLDLIAPQWYIDALNAKPELIDSVENGVGSETSWTYHLTPNTIWMLNITPCSSIHGLCYTYPLNFSSVAEGLAWKRKADFQFYLNVKKQIRDYGGWLINWRNSRLDKYMVLLECGGSEAFWTNKDLPTDFLDYYEDKPGYLFHVVNRYQRIWRKIISI